MHKVAPKYKRISDFFFDFVAINPAVAAIIEE